MRIFRKSVSAPPAEAASEAPAEAPVEGSAPAGASAPAEAAAPEEMPLKDRLKDYFKEPHHAELVGLQAVSYTTQVGALTTSFVPVVGNVCNAVNMVADVATAVERLRTREPGEHIQKSTIIADWAAVAIDLVSIVFPPVQWGNVALAAWDAKQSYEFLAHRPPAHA